MIRREGFLTHCLSLSRALSCSLSLSRSLALYAGIDLQRPGRVIKQGAIKHSYPFCWRSDTPLIYKAVPSWFVKVLPHSGLQGMFRSRLECPSERCSPRQKPRVELLKEKVEPLLTQVKVEIGWDINMHNPLFLRIATVRDCYRRGLLP